MKVNRSLHPALVCAVPIGADGPISYASCKCGWRVEGPLTDAQADAAWNAHLKEEVTT